MSSLEHRNNKIAVLIPCYNEEVTIHKVVSDFKRELPEADIYVNPPLHVRDGAAPRPTL